MTQKSTSVLQNAAARKARYTLADLVPELDRASEALRRAGRTTNGNELDRMRRRVTVIMGRLSQ